MMTETSELFAPLEACAATFGNLQQTLADPAAHSQLDAIRKALDATAQNVSNVHGVTELDRDNLTKLYRGLLAAGRIVTQLAERRSSD